MALKLPVPKQIAASNEGGVYRAVRTAQVLGKGTDAAAGRRLKLNDALGKLRSAAGK